MKSEAKSTLILRIYQHPHTYVINGETEAGDTVYSEILPRSPKNKEPSFRKLVELVDKDSRFAQIFSRILIQIFADEAKIAKSATDVTVPVKVVPDSDGFKLQIPKIDPAYGPKSQQKATFIFSLENKFEQLFAFIISESMWLNPQATIVQLEFMAGKFGGAT